MLAGDGTSGNLNFHVDIIFNFRRNNEKNTISEFGSIHEYRF